jgi:2-haloacid dehalogenase
MNERLEGVEVLTFDCYGTLIDWNAGVRRALAALESLEGCDHDQLVRDRGAADMRLTKRGYMPYDQVLRESLRAAAEAQDAGVTAGEAREFSISMSRWPAFAEAPAALARLARNHRLAILSNVRSAVLENSVAALGVEFESLITAEELHSYKPRHGHFEEALRRLRVSHDKVLHVACSPYHDLAVAEELGWRDAWIDRTGEPLCPGLSPTVTVSDLDELCRELGVD